MNLNKYRALFLGLSMFLGSLTLPAQDLMARQSPVDHRTKAVDSVALERLLEAEDAASEEASELYSTWNTNYAHCYSKESVPETFKIDLRGFHMPTPSRKITSGFGYRPTFKRVHKGLDIKVYTGDTISAAFDGKVRVVKYEANGYGNYVVIRHSNGLETIYGHLSKHLVKTNDVVKAGQPIGLGGNTGRSFGSHLHFETRLLGVAIDPALLFDFANQDVTGDYYVFNSRTTHSSRTVAQPAATSVQTRPATQGSRSRGGHFYKVKRGDNLYSIARKLGVSLEALCAANRLGRRTSIRAGQILKY